MKINLHKITKCITLKSIFVNNLNLAIVRIPLVIKYPQLNKLPLFKLVRGSAGEVQG